MRKPELNIAAAAIATSLSLIAMSAKAGNADTATSYGATVIHSFGGLPNSGASPQYGNLALGRDGNFYGVTPDGGVNGTGTIFRTKSDGSTITLHSFAANGDPSGNTDGRAPTATLTQGSDGSFYGVAGLGGSNDTGTLFKIGTNGTFTLLHTFSGYASNGTNADGIGPEGPLLAGRDGSVYGVTPAGGRYGGGVAYRITSDGTFTVLHNFGKPLASGGTEISSPHGGLIAGNDGNLYGVTYGSVQNSNITGSLFRLSLNGDVTVVTYFYGSTSDINYPMGIVLGDDGNFYGAAFTGRIFRVTPAGDLTVLHDGNDQGPYASGTKNIDGSDLNAGMAKGADGNFYGTAAFGGEFGGGELFRITPAGDFSVLYNFASTATDADVPYGGVTFGADGNLYGTTVGGGAHSKGTIYKLPMPVPAGWGSGPLITVDASISPTSISKSAGQTATLTWSATNAAQCHVMGAVVATSGSVTITPIVPGVFDFDVACDNAGKATVAMERLKITR